MPETFNSYRCCCLGLLERMKAGEFDLDMVDYNSPDPPDIDQMKKDELYAL